MRIGSVLGARRALGGPLLLACLLAGCVKPVRYATPERLDRGYTAFLVGILGNRNSYNTFVDSLVEAGVPCAFEIVDWSLGPAMATVNMHAAERHRGAAKEVAARIVDYQKAYPGRPVFLIGHSGGAGVALLVLEELAPGRKVTAAILLGAAVDHDQSLVRALSHVERGIWNYFSTEDTGMLGVGSAFVGNFGGSVKEPAGLVGFSTPVDLTPYERLLYRTRLHQVRFTEEMRALDNDGGHWGWLRPSFTRAYISKLLQREGHMPALTASDPARLTAATR